MVPLCFSFPALEKHSFLCNLHDCDTVRVRTSAVAHGTVIRLASSVSVKQKTLRLYIIVSPPGIRPYTTSTRPNHLKAEQMLEQAVQRQMVGQAGFWSTQVSSASPLKVPSLREERFPRRELGEHQARSGASDQRITPNRHGALSITPSQQAHPL